MTRRMAAAAAVLAVGLWLAAAAVAQDYEIKIHRPVKVGLKYQLSVQAEHKQTVTVDGEVSPDDSEEFSAELKALAEVLGVDDKGRSAKESYTVEKLTVTQGGAAKSLVKKGTVIVATAALPENLYQIDGQPVGEDLKKVLSIVLELDTEGPTGDEVAGTQERKKPGESWAMNAELAAQDLQKRGIEIEKDGLAGALTLEKAVKVGDIPCLRIRVDVTLKKFKPGMPPWATQLLKASGKVTSTAKLPVDTSLPSLGDTTSMKIGWAFKGAPAPGQPELTVGVDIETKTTKSMNYLR